MPNIGLFLVLRKYKTGAENISLNRMIDSTLLSRRIYNRYLYCIQHLEISLVLDSTGEMVLAQAQNFDIEIRTFIVCLFGCHDICFSYWSAHGNTLLHVVWRRFEIAGQVCILCISSPVVKHSKQVYIWNYEVGQMGANVILVEGGLLFPGRHFW